MSLPQPDAFATQHSRVLMGLLEEQIAQAGGWLSFADFMSTALYSPGLGYYAAGSSKFGSTGDFVTAPELTSLFARALAVQVAQIMAHSAPRLIEVGAGTGRLAADLLLALDAMGRLPDRYEILELSADLRERQAAMIRAKAPQLIERVSWLDRLPESFSGCVLANELIDAMPVHRVAWLDNEIVEIGVGFDPHQSQFVWLPQPASGRLCDAAQAIFDAAEQAGDPLPVGYQSEINLAGAAWAASWGEILQQGVLLLIDYGFPRHEFYHRDRRMGTLMCHYRHHAHPDPFWWPGLQDITAHVDFTSLIEAAFPAGLELLGYTSQGQFLLNCGILAMLEAESAGDFTTPRAVQAAGMVNRLILPQEMGELFKVIAMGKNIPVHLQGFMQGDRSYQL